MDGCAARTVHGQKKRIFSSGLPIVKKIIEEHDGTLDLMPAPVFEGSARPGAWARIVLPRALPDRAWEDDERTRITEKLREAR